MKIEALVDWQVNGSNQLMISESPRDETNLLLRRIIACAGLVSVSLVRFVVTNDTASRGADFTMPCHVTRDAANYRAFYAALSLGSGRQD